MRSTSQQTTFLYTEEIKKISYNYKPQKAKKCHTLSVRMLLPPKTCYVTKFRYAESELNSQFTAQIISDRSGIRCRPDLSIFVTEKKIFQACILRNLRMLQGLMLLKYLWKFSYCLVPNVSEYLESFICIEQRIFIKLHHWICLGKEIVRVMPKKSF